MDFTSIAVWGFVATIVLTTIMAAGQGLGLTRMSLPFILGTALTSNRNRVMLVGSLFHALNGWLFAFLYAVVFETTIHRATWWIGAIGGFVHGCFVLVVLLPILTGLHPRMASDQHGPTPTRQLQPPGFIGMNYGRQTLLVTLVAHIVYGAIVGAFYTPH